LDKKVVQFRRKGIGEAGNALDTFLRNQDQAGFDRDHGATVQQAESMINNRFAIGCDITSAYPDWMIAYIQGIAVPNALHASPNGRRTRRCCGRPPAAWVKCHRTSKPSSTRR